MSFKLRIVNYKILVILFIVTGLFACTERMEIHTSNSDPVIVIYGCITDSLDYQSVRISSSSPYFTNEANAKISGAIVTIVSSQDEIFELYENNSVKGLYQTSGLMAGVVGVTYKLKVEYDFNKDGIKESYEASTTMQPPVLIDSVKISALQVMGNNLFQFDLYAFEPPEEDYYLCRYSINDSLIDTKISRYQLLGDIGLNGQYINGLTLSYFTNASDKDSYSEEEAKNRNFVTPGDKITMEMNKIEKIYFDFLTQCQKEQNGENPFFGGPASNIVTNISNGGIGCFSAYSIVKTSGIVPQF